MALSKLMLIKKGKTRGLESKVEEKKTGSGQSILVVDDNQDSRELVVKVLKNRGYQMIEAVDGEDALEKAIALRPCLVLMDISLPKMDGYEVTRNLRLHDNLKQVPVIALTAHAMKGDEEKVLQAGLDGYIPKPINVRELPGQVESYLKKHT
jgi:two-component system cell cycle response regulator DivK